MKTRVILVCGWTLALGALVSPAAAQPLLAEPSGASVLGPEGSFRARLAGPRRAERLRRGGLSERARAAAALGRRGAAGPAVDALIDALERESAGPVRVEIARALARRGDARGIVPLANALTRGSRDPASPAIADALAALGGGDAIGALVSSLAGLEASSAALMRLGPAAIPFLVDSLDRGEAVLPVMELLGRLGSSFGTAALLEKLRGEDPTYREAAARALGQLGDGRAAPALRIAASDDPDAAVRIAAVRALGRVGSAEDVAFLEAQIGVPGMDELALVSALVALEPSAARPHVERLLASGRPLAPLLADWSAPPRPELLPFYVAAARDEREALGAIAALDSPASRRALATLAAALPAARLELARLIAASFGRAEDFSEEESAELGWLDAIDDPLVSLELRVVAGDPAVVHSLAAALEGDDAAAVSTAARALAVSPLPCPRASLSAAAHFVATRLGGGHEAALFRDVAGAALRCELPVASRVYAPRLVASQTDAEAMAWAAISTRGASWIARDALGRTLRRGLRSAEARTRAGAARALGLLGDAAAGSRLLRVLDDPDPHVRLVAIRAIGRLGGGDRVALEAAWRAEPDPQVRAAIAAVRDGWTTPPRWDHPGSPLGGVSAPL